MDFTRNMVLKFAFIAGGSELEKSWGVPQAGGWVEIKLEVESRYELCYIV